MVRNVNTRRITSSQSVAINRKISPSITSGVLQRSRLAARQKNIQMLNAQDKENINQIINQINSGRINNINQIPSKYLRFINVSQEQIRNISQYKKALEQAKLWDSAYKLADRVLSSKNPAAIFAIGFSKNPYAKTAYRDLQAKYSNYKIRKANLENIINGKIKNVSIKGGRIFDTISGKPITPAKASQRQYVNDIKKSLPTGETLIVDKNYNIKGISSKALGKTFNFSASGINAYNNAIVERKPFNFNKRAKELKMEDLKTGQSVEYTIPEKIRKETEKIRKEANTKITQAKNRILFAKPEDRVQITPDGKLTISSTIEGDIAGYALNSIIKSLADIGLGSADLVKAIKENPAIVLGLPGALVGALAEDYKKVTSNNPFGLADVLIEYATLGKVGKIAGKTTKFGARLTKADKAALFLAKKFSPIYISKLIRKELLPPTKLMIAAAKTGSGRKAIKLSNELLKNPAIKAKVKRYKLKLQKGKSEVDRRLRNINRRIEAAKKTTSRKIAKYKTAAEIRRIKQRAKKFRKKDLKKGITKIISKDTSYTEAKEVLEYKIKEITEYKINKYLRAFKQQGGKLGAGQKEKLIQDAQREMIRRLKNTKTWKELTELEKLNEGFAITLIKQGKIKRAYLITKKTIESFKKQKLPKKILSLIKKVTIIKRPIKKAKKTISKKITKYKTAAEIRRTKQRAKKFRKKSKWKQAFGGDDRYEKVKVVLEEVIKNKAVKDVDNFIKNYKKQGGKIGLGIRDDLIRTLTRNRINEWKKTREYFELDRLSKFNEKYLIEFRKIKKLEPIKKLFSKAVKKINALKSPTSLFRQKIRIKKRRLIKKIKRPLQVRAERKRVRQTIRYRMEKQRPVREVTISQLVRARELRKVNKLIDMIFKEIEKRQKITVGTKTYSQMKNIVKKRIRRAAKKGDKAELKKIGDFIKQLFKQMNEKKKRPDIKVSETLKPTKVSGIKNKVYTIKEFNPEVPKGTYQEVKSGQTVLLQKVKTKQSPVIKSKAKILQVQKKKIDFKPLFKYLFESITLNALAKVSATAQIPASASASATAQAFLQDQRQDLKIAQDLANAIGLKINVSQAVASKLKPKLKMKMKLRTVKSRKQKIIKAKLISKPTRKKVVGKKVLGFKSKVRRKKKVSKLNRLPISKERAFDILAYNLDKTKSYRGLTIKSLQRVSTQVLNRKLKAAPTGYFRKNRKKFTIRRLKRGIETYEMIEKKKYRMSAKGERRKMPTRRKKR